MKFRGPMTMREKHEVHRLRFGGKDCKIDFRFVVDSRGFGDLLIRSSGGLYPPLDVYSMLQEFMEKCGADQARLFGMKLVVMIIFQDNPEYDEAKIPPVKLLKFAANKKREGLDHEMIFIYLKF